MSGTAARGWSLPAGTDPALTAVREWWGEHQRELPWRASRDPYAVWVAEVMSAQTQVSRAAARWVRWMGRWPTVEALAQASLADVLSEWQGLGYPRRARDLHRSAQIVTAAGWPERLTDLPGIGPYVAAAIRCFALEEPVLPLDTNVRRVLGRRFPGGVDITGDPWRTGQALMEFGQRICSARPRCAECPVHAGCDGPRGGPLADGRSASAARRQPRYEGSLRQRRGRLLTRVLTEGAFTIGEPDRAAATGLAEDGLAILADGVLYPPG